MERPQSHFLTALADDFSDFGELNRLGHVTCRLLMAALLGGILGYQRQMAGKDAGLRTHMLVAVGAAFFVVVPQFEHFNNAEMSRVLQGLLAGIGFLSGGAILKLAAEKEIHGLTTATGIWITSAIGIAAGFGRMGTALVGTFFTLLILSLLQRLEANQVAPQTVD